MTKTTPDLDESVILNLNLNFSQLHGSVKSLIQTLSSCDNVSTDLKSTLLGNIDVTDSLAAKIYSLKNSNDMNFVQRRFNELQNQSSSEKFFSISNSKAELTCLNSEKIIYKDLASKTTLTFSANIFSEVTLQEENGKEITIPDSQKPKVFDALQVSKNMKDMLLTVHTAHDKLTKLQELDNSATDPRIKTIDDIVKRIKSIQETSEPKNNGFSFFTKN